MEIKNTFLKRRIKASLTLEASFVITMTILVSGILLSLWIYKFQECWYTQGINECLLTGSNDAILNDEEYINNVKQKWNSIKKENYLIPQDLLAQINGNSKKITIKMNANVPIYFWDSLQIDIEQNIKIIKPVGYIYKRVSIWEAMGM